MAAKTATTLRQDEGIPAEYPDPPIGLSDAALVPLSAAVWQRIEAWCAHRWSERDVVWTVEGCGPWRPPLAPATITTVEVWRDGWQAADLPESPMGGHELPGGLYRFTGTAGDDDAPIPAAVLDAYRRLAEYLGDKPARAGATFESVTAGSVSLSHRRSANWIAQAMQASGAADLLRPYRRAG